MISKDKKMIEQSLERIYSEFSKIESAVGLSLGSRTKYDEEFGNTAEGIRINLKEYQSKIKRLLSE